jgi:uncharacterized protein YndB with AHSA1/START domain
MGGPQRQTKGGIKMVKIEQSVVINRPVEDVFAFMSNPKNDPQWQSDTTETEITSQGPIGVGTTYRDVTEFLGRRIESIYEFTEYEANRKLSLKTTSGPIPIEATITWESVEDGTEVNFSASGEVGGFFKLAEPLVGRMTQRTWATNYANLKDLLESQD